MVKAECRRAALVPEQAGDGMVGHMVASALAKLTFAPKGMVEGDGAEGLLARADHLLEVKLPQKHQIPDRRDRFEEMFPYPGAKL